MLFMAFGITESVRRSDDGGEEGKEREYKEGELGRGKESERERESDRENVSERVSERGRSEKDFLMDDAAAMKVV